MKHRFVDDVHPSVSTTPTPRFDCTMTLVAVLPVVSLCLHLTSATPPRVLVVSFDGFRHDYVDAEVTPFMFAQRRNSSWAEYMANIFPTKTFPNHHAIANGVYAEVHGVIGSHLVDGNLSLGYGQQMFNYNPKLAPIWIRNQQQEGRHSGSMMWLGGEFRYQATVATFTRPLDKKAVWEKKVDTVISWFLHPATPANLVMMYFEQPDIAAHRFGTKSDEMRTQVRRVDAIVSYLTRRLEESVPDANVFLLSDHGMADVATEDIIDLPSCAVLTALKPHFTLVGSSPVLQVRPALGHEAAVSQALRSCADDDGHFKVYRKDELPAEWHIRDNARVPALLVVADVNYGFDDLVREFAPAPGGRLGVHGYDNRLPIMYPMFMAWGPLIRRDHRLEPFNNVDLYSLWCHVLGLADGQSNGRFENVKSMLVSESFGCRLQPGRASVIAFVVVICNFLFDKV